jgi:hypothetical protein
MGNLVPFNSNKHKPLDVGNGVKMTEFLMTERSPEGTAWNIPSVWFDDDTGKPVRLRGDDAWNEALRYEKRTGNKFPRFKDLDSGIEAAKSRSDSGGATKESLVGRKSLIGNND